jgi:hypothetical protein
MQLSELPVPHSKVEVTIYGEFVESGGEFFTIQSEALPETVNVVTFRWNQCQVKLIETPEEPSVVGSIMLDRNGKAWQLENRNPSRAHHEDLRWRSPYAQEWRRFASLVDKNNQHASSYLGPFTLVYVPATEESE